MSGAPRVLFCVRAYDGVTEANVAPAYEETPDGPLLTAAASLPCNAFGVDVAVLLDSEVVGGVRRTGWIKAGDVLRLTATIAGPAAEDVRAALTGKHRDRRADD